MGRNKSDFWAHFDKCAHDSSFRTPRAKCKYCKTTISSTPKNMRTHYGNCSSVPRSVGRLPNENSSVSPSLRSNISKQSKKTTTSTTLSNIILETLTTDKRKELDMKFSMAMHATATPFKFFEHHLWISFFSSVSKWNTPNPEKIGGELLDKVYGDVMSKVLAEVCSAGGGTLSIDGATDNLAKSKSNVILHTPIPFFIEYMRSDLKRETTPNVVKKLEDTIKRLHEKVGMKCISSFVSDSCNGMRDVRKTLQEKNLVRWSYGCAAHCLNNFSEDIGKNLFKDVIKKCVFIMKTIKNNGMLRKIFDKICMEKHKRTFSLPLYCKTRWSSVNYMLMRLLQLRSVVSFIPHALLHERNTYGIDESYCLPPALSAVVLDPDVWKQAEAAHGVFHHICQCIGCLEADEATMATAYACALSVRIHIHDHDAICDDDRMKLDAMFLRQWNRIYSPIHSLAFKCDPLYKTYAARVEESYRRGFIDMDHDIIINCHEATDMLKDDQKHGEQVMHEFMDYCVKPYHLLDNLKEWNASLIWGQVQAQYPCLSKVLYNVYRAPASTAGVERNHKVNKRVLNNLRCRLSDDRVEKQVSVAHNKSQLDRERTHKRLPFDLFIARDRATAGTEEVDVTETGEHVQDGVDFNVAASVGTDSLQGVSNSFTHDSEENDNMLSLGEIELEHNVWDFSDPASIIDSVLFNDE